MSSQYRWGQCCWAPQGCLSRTSIHMAWLPSIQMHWWRHKHPSQHVSHQGAESRKISMARHRLQNLSHCWAGEDLQQRRLLWRPNKKRWGPRLKRTSNIQQPDVFRWITSWHFSRTCHKRTKLRNIRWKRFSSYSNLLIQVRLCLADMSLSRWITALARSSTLKKFRLLGAKVLKNGVN